MKPNSANKWIIVLVILALGVGIVTVKAATLPVEFFLAEADFTVIGEENGDWAAYFASPAGDVNGDGYYDFLIGAPMAGNKVCPYPDEEDCTGLLKGEGKAYLVLGKPQSQWPASPLNLAYADASFLGCKVNSMTARQLYTAGDVNGDGYDDMIISGWKCGNMYEGKAYLVLGRPAADWGQDFPLDTAADASFVGEHEWDMASYYVSTAGDVNGDGYDDVLVTVTHNDEAADNAGQVYLILGRAGADWGRDFSLADADASFLGEDIEDRIGRAATYIGDINADGYDDFMIGSVSSDDGGVDAGESYLFLGRAAADWGMDFPIAQADSSFVGENAYDESGRRMAAAGDVNSDGYDDFLIGASKNDDNGPDAGKTYLFLGEASPNWGSDTSLAEADAIFVGEAIRDQSGRRISGVGDPNHDGYDDFLIGAPHNNRNGDAAGAAYLIYGRPDADWGKDFILTNADITYLGKPEIGVAGYDVAWVGDFDGDLIDDFLIAAYGGRNNETVPGEAYLILGNDLPIIEVVSPEDGYQAGIEELISFEGSASDPTDGDLTDNITWNSDLDGLIGQGGSVLSNLSEGLHTITGEVTDSGGLVVKDQRTVEILSNFPPDVSILYPEHWMTFPEESVISFSGEAFDVEDGDISSQIIWSSNLDGQFGVGESFDYAGLSPGRHKIYATVQDTDGVESSMMIVVIIMEKFPNEQVGFYAPSKYRWYLKTNREDGWSGVISIGWGGVSELQPVVGDWDGDGVDTPAFYKPSQFTWFIKNDFNDGWAGVSSFSWGGASELIPLAGNWDGDNDDTAAFYKPSTGEWFLKYENTPGWSGYEHVIFGGAPGNIPIAGDWDGDGYDTIGFFVPSQNIWYLKNDLTDGWDNVIGFNFGTAAPMDPVVGDWDGDRIDTVGGYTASNWRWYLKNDQVTGWSNVTVIKFGVLVGFEALAGDWQ